MNAAANSRKKRSRVWRQKRRKNSATAIDRAAMAPSIICSTSVLLHHEAPKQERNGSQRRPQSPEAKVDLDREHDLVRHQQHIVDGQEHEAPEGPSQKLRAGAALRQPE